MKQWNDHLFIKHLWINKVSSSFNKRVSWSLIYFQLSLLCFFVPASVFPLPRFLSLSRRRRCHGDLAPKPNFKLHLEATCVFSWLTAETDTRRLKELNVRHLKDSSTVNERASFPPLRQITRMWRVFGESVADRKCCTFHLMEFQALKRNVQLHFPSKTRWDKNSPSPPAAQFTHRLFPGHSQAETSDWLLGERHSRCRPLATRMSWFVTSSDRWLTRFYRFLVGFSLTGCLFHFIWSRFRLKLK